MLTVHVMTFITLGASAANSIPAGSAHAQGAAAGRRPEQAFASGAGNREDVQAVIKGLRQDLQLSVTVQVGNGGRRR